MLFCFRRYKRSAGMTKKYSIFVWFYSRIQEPGSGDRMCEALQSLTHSSGEIISSAPGLVEGNVCGESRT